MPFERTRETHDADERSQVTSRKEGAPGGAVQVELLKSRVNPYMLDGNMFVPNMDSRWQQFKQQQFYEKKDDPIHVKYFGVLADQRAQGLRVAGRHSGNYLVDGHDNISEFGFSEGERDRHSDWGYDEEQEDEDRQSWVDDEYSHEFLMLYNKEDAHDRWEERQEHAERHGRHEEDAGDAEDGDDDRDEYGDAEEDHDEEPPELTQAERHRLEFLKDRRCIRTACVISRMDAQDKYSEGYLNCIGYAVFGISKKTGERVSLLGHLNVNHLTEDSDFSKEMEYHVKKSLREAAYCCQSHSIEVVCWGGKISIPEEQKTEMIEGEPTSDDTYRRAMLRLGACVQGVFDDSIDPVIVSQPITFGQDRVHAYADTEHRKIIISRPPHSTHVAAHDRVPTRMSELRALDAYAQRIGRPLNTLPFGKRGDPDQLYPDRGVPDETGHTDFW